MKIYDEKGKLLNEKDVDYSKGILLVKETIYTYHEYSEEEMADYNLQGQINSLKQHLASTDYLAIKYAEGELSKADYAETKAQRKAWREEIRKLEDN